MSSRAGVSERLRRIMKESGASAKSARGLALKLAATLCRNGRSDEALQLLRSLVPGIDGSGELKRLQDELAEGLGYFPFQRAFRLYCVGHSKTGTNSVCSVLRNWRMEHDFKAEETARMIAARSRGELATGELADYARRRDAAGRLEVDSSRSHQGWVSVLAEVFPDARFLFTIRDVWSWLDSTLNQYLRRAAEPETRARFERFVVPGTTTTVARAFSSERELLKRFDAVAEMFAAEWAGVNEKTLAQLPKGRTLIVRTHEIGDRLADIAAHVGVPEGSLNAAGAHENKARARFGVLARVEPRRLERVERLAAPLMSAHFPGWTLRGFLEGRDRKPVGGRA
jgi:hypothetical protein